MRAIILTALLTAITATAAPVYNIKTHKELSGWHRVPYRNALPKQRQGATEGWREVVEFVAPSGMVKVAGTRTLADTNTTPREVYATITEAAASNVLVQAATDWNNSKTNHADIILWENRFMMRLGQVNGILMIEGIITQPLTPRTAAPNDVATYIIQATNAQASSVGIALDACDKWTTNITTDEIGVPPDGKPVRHHITSH